MKTSELTGAALDWAVARCEGFKLAPIDAGDSHVYYDDKQDNLQTYAPSTDWIQGGPIIEREGITLVCAEGDYSPKERIYEIYWVAEEGCQWAQNVYGPQGDDWGTCFQIEERITGKTPLIAAMRFYVASKLGDEVEIPKELK